MTTDRIREALAELVAAYRAPAPSGAGDFIKWYDRGNKALDDAEVALAEPAAVQCVPSFNSRALFEQWYTKTDFDYECDPIDSERCGLQRAAWQAGVNTYAAHVAALAEPAAVQGVPVAWFLDLGGKHALVEWRGARRYPIDGDWKPLYASPPAAAQPTKKPKA